MPAAGRSRRSKRCVTPMLVSESDEATSSRRQPILLRSAGRVGCRKNAGHFAANWRENFGQLYRRLRRSVNFSWKGFRLLRLFRPKLAPDTSLFPGRPIRDSTWPNGATWEPGAASCSLRRPLTSFTETRGRGKMATGRLPYWCPANFRLPYSSMSVAALGSWRVS
jgi:hypothetical protein